MRPLLLDLFCGAGGCSVGYHRAGFDVVGVDINPQPNYPFEFHRADALEYVDARRFDAVHASPPCQAHSDLQKQNKRMYRDFIVPVRRRLRESGLPYVIENVEGAPLESPVVLCGTMFEGLRVIRHRLFETNWPLTAPLHPPGHPLVFTHDKRKAHHGRLDQSTAFVQVTGGGNATVANKAAAMGIDWMTGAELNEAIPPAYTEWVGRQLLEYIGASVPKREVQTMAEFPYKPVSNGCDICGRSAPLSRVVLAAGDRRKLERVAYVCDAHGVELGAPVPDAGSRASGLQPQQETLM